MDIIFNLVEDSNEKKLYKCNLSVFAPLSLWLALHTISLASRWSVASLELQLALPSLLFSQLLAWAFAAFISL